MASHRKPTEINQEKRKGKDGKGGLEILLTQQIKFGEAQGLNMQNKILGSMTRALSEYSLSIYCLCFSFC